MQMAYFAIPNGGPARLISYALQEEKNMLDQNEKPFWDPNDKEKSLQEYALWLNNIAREAFLHLGHHEQMFFFVTETGEIEGCQFRDGLPREKRDATIQQQQSLIKPYGTIQILITQIYHPALTLHPKAQQLSFVGDAESNSKELVRDCLLVRVLSRNGKDKMLANPIIREGNRVVLAPMVITSPAHI